MFAYEDVSIKSLQESQKGEKLTKTLLGSHYPLRAFNLDQDNDSWALQVPWIWSS
jgi:hypothetical protein